MTDPFNVFLQNKLATFKNILSSRMNYQDLFIKDISEGRIPLARGIGEASILRKPATDKEKEQMTDEELEAENKRVYNRTALMIEYKIQEEIERLFADD